MRQLVAILCVLAPAAAGAASTAFVNVNVIAMSDESVAEAQTVIVTDGRITAIGHVDVTALPADAEIVDGTDRYLLPGLAEMHGHVTSTTAESLDWLFGLYVANGVTTVRGMLGRPEHLALRQRLAEGEVLGPRLVTSGPSLNGGSVRDPEQGAGMVSAQHAAGYDFIKIHPGLTRAEFVAITEAASRLGMPVAGHVPEEVGVPLALESGIATIDHLDGYMETLIPAHEDPTGGVGGFFGLLLSGQADEKRIPAIAAATAAAGVWNVPTESLFEHMVDDVDVEDIRKWHEMRYVSRSTVDEWIGVKRELMSDRNYSAGLATRAIDLRRRLILELHRAGAGLLLGSDSPQRFNVPGFSLHRELELLVAAGLTPWEALRTGTVNPAVFLGMQEDMGTIEVGKVADLLLLDENPLADISNSRRVHGTMLRGRWVPRTDIDAMLAQAERR